MTEADRKKITLTDADRKDIALAEYKEVADQFRKLTDIRFQLLTYLPLGTAAAAVFVAKDNYLEKHPEISAFAFVVTLCIATYNKRNDQHYDELVSRAAELERDLQIEHGSFSDRPKPWLKYGPVPVEHRWPIGLIYAAAASLWAYLFTAALLNTGWTAALVKNHTSLIWLQLATPAVVLACWQGLHLMENARNRKQREAVKSLMGQLVGSKVVETMAAQPRKLADSIAAQRILGIGRVKAGRRVAYHWQGYEQKRDSRAASDLLSAVIDLPARWIEDVWSGRR